MNKKARVDALTILLLMIMLVVGIGAIFCGLTIEESTERVDCYDRHNNQILGQKCLEEKASIEEKYFVIGYGFVFIIAGIMIFVAVNNYS